MTLHHHIRCSQDDHRSCSEDAEQGGNGPFVGQVAGDGGVQRVEWIRRVGDLARVDTQ